MKTSVLYYVFIICCSFVMMACNKGINDVMDPEESYKADAGGDKTLFAGSYSVWDASKSIIPDSGKVKIIEWISDENNPEVFSTYTTASLTESYVVGFAQDGNYNFTLKITCKNGSILTDKFKVIIKKRQSGLIEDINLEINIRKLLKYPIGDLTKEVLMKLDTLNNYDVSIKNKIRTLTGLENCEKLKYLALGLQSIIDLKPLVNLTNLEYLDLSQNRIIVDISPIYNLKNLHTLSLYGNPITNIDGIVNLKKLKKLLLSFVPINGIKSLQYLNDLEYLDLGGATIENLEPLRNLTKLTHLWIGACGINDIKPLENLENLFDALYLNFNNLKEISSVYKMKKLVRLYIGSNQIEDLSGIKYLENLDYLDAANNKIKDIGELAYLKNIHMIGLSNNKIEDIKPLVDNENLTKGVAVFLTGNPLNEKSINEYIPILLNRGITIFK